MANRPLALRELRRLASTFQSRLLAFLYARIATEEPGALQDNAEVWVDQEQRAADAVTNSVGLRRLSSSFRRDFHVERLHLIRDLERRNGVFDERTEEVMILW